MRSQSYLERYLKGEQRQVWSELRELKEAIRDEPLFSDTVSVAHETMRRVRNNLEIVHKRLLELDYKFLYPDRVIVPPNEQTDQIIQKLEQKAGSLPLSLREWYKVVGSVNMRGDHQRLGVSEPQGPATDPLVIAPLEELLNDTDYPGSWDSDANYFADLSVDLWHKAGYSGGNDYVVRIPNYSIDAPIEGMYDWPYPHEVFFVDYLRISLKFGGFAAFHLYGDSNLPRWVSAWGNEPWPSQELEYLTHGLTSF